jgi:hypothetical protein
MEGVQSRIVMSKAAGKGSVTSMQIHVLLSRDIGAPVDGLRGTVI